MNKDKLREEIAEDEGCKYEVYLDHLGLPTCGIGHLIKDGEPEHSKPVGTRICGSENENCCIGVGG